MDLINDLRGHNKLWSASETCQGKSKLFGCTFRHLGSNKSDLQNANYRPILSIYFDIVHKGACKKAQEKKKKKETTTSCEHILFGINKFSIAMNLQSVVINHHCDGVFKRQWRCLLQQLFELHLCGIVDFQAAGANSFKCLTINIAWRKEIKTVLWTVHQQWPIDCPFSRVIFLCPASEMSNSECMNVLAWHNRKCRNLESCRSNKLNAFSTAPEELSLRVRKNLAHPFAQDQSG